MVYYFTSGNVKLLRNIIGDYENINDTTPYEYMLTYAEKCPKGVDDTKLKWIVDTFLSFCKHKEFLTRITSHFENDLTHEELVYFRIIFLAIIFQIQPKDVQLLYKCFFNLSKPLLNIFTKFLSNNEILTFISQVAQVSYDATYITNKIIEPLFEWQPYISEMEHTYAEYLQRINGMKLKPVTIPVQPNVLTHKHKEMLEENSVSSQKQVLVPSTVVAKKKMLSKKTIDRRLKKSHEKNKKKSQNLLNDVKNNKSHYAQGKSKKNHNVVAGVEKELHTILPNATSNNKISLIKGNIKPDIKETVTTVKRLEKRIQMEEVERNNWLKGVICYTNTAKLDEIAEQERQEREGKRLLEIEKKHLMGLLSYEEAVLAKNKVISDKKRQYEEFLKEKESWNKELEIWRQNQLEKKQKYLEKASMAQLSLIQAKTENITKKKEAVETLKKEATFLKEKAMKIKNEELERKIKMIKELKVLEIIAKKSREPKFVDLTETAGLGLFCEMSIAELQEKISVMTIQLKEEIERKQKAINNEREAAKRQLEASKNVIKDYMEERAQIRQHNKQRSTQIVLNNVSLKKNDDLKKILEEKRHMRMKLKNPFQ